MSGNVVRELVTLWGFDIDQKPLKELDIGINMIKSSLAGLGIAVGIASAGVGYLLNEAGEDEQTRIAFETMLGSAELAAKKLEELKQFAATTPFELTGLKEASKRLLAFNFSADELIPTLKALGDIASGVGMDKLPQLILAFGQVRAATRLTGMELRQFTEAGVPLLGELAKNLGKTEGQIQEMIHDKKIGFKDVQKALFALTTGSGRFANLMEKQSHSFLGIISNIKDWINIVAIDIGNELLPVAKDLLNTFMEWATENKDFIKGELLKFFKTLVDMIFGMINVGKAFFGILSGIVHLFGDWNTAISMTTKLLTVFLGLGLLYGIGLIAQGLYGLTAAWYAMGSAAMFAQLKMMLIPLAIGAVIAAIALIAEDIYAFTQGRDSVFGRFVQGLGKAFDWVSEKFAGLGEFMRTIIANVLTPIRMLINGFKSIGIMIDMIRGKTGFLDGVKQIAGNTLNAMNPMANNGSLEQALGFGNVFKDATQFMNNSKSPMIGLGGTNPANPQTQTVNAKNEITLNVTGMEPKAAEEMVLGSLNDTLGNMMRSATRDGGSQIER